MWSNTKYGVYTFGVAGLVAILNQYCVKLLTDNVFVQFHFNDMIAIFMCCSWAVFWTALLFQKANNTTIGIVVLIFAIACVIAFEPYGHLFKKSAVYDLWDVIAEIVALGIWFTAWFSTLWYQPIPNSVQSKL